MKIPLFPLRSVLFPQGLLQLRVFEVRYMDMVRDCMRTHTPFGVVLISQEKNHETMTGIASSLDLQQLDTLNAPSIYTVGTLAQVVNFDMDEPGVLLIVVQGAQRFKVLTTKVQPNGLMMADVELLAPDEDVPLQKDFLLCADLMEQLLKELDTDYAQMTSQGKQALSPVVAQPYQCQNTVWLSNRHAELMPIPKEAKQALLMLQDADERLSLIYAFLKEKDVL